MASRADTERERRAANAALVDWLAREESRHLEAAARRAGVEPDAVADVVQSALIGVLRFFPGPPERDAIRGYAYRCVQTEAWKLHRTRQRHQSQDVTLERVAEPELDEDEEPSSLVIRADEVREAAALLAELPATERAALVLLAAGFEREQVRRVLGLSERALRKRVERGNRRLRELRGARS